MEELMRNLKGQIIEALSLEDLEIEDIDNDEPLFGEGLGLDSIDALELTVLLQKEYGLKIENPEDGKKVFHSIRRLAEYILESQESGG